MLCSAECSKNSTKATNTFHLAENPTEKQNPLSFRTLLHLAHLATAAKCLPTPDTALICSALSAPTHTAEGSSPVYKKAVFFYFESILKIN